MNQSWNNNRFLLNGHVKPSIVLRSETETLIAQNAHNLIWEKYRNEYDALIAEIDDIKKSGGNINEADERFKTLYTTAKQEIDELVLVEITAYRKERAGRNYIDIEERIEHLEKMIEEIRDLAEDAQSTAEEALDKVE